MPATSPSSSGLLPCQETTAVSLRDRLTHHSILVVTDEELFRMREARQKGGRTKLKTA